ncbi:hypothetical protein [Mycobacterium sp. Lab-001]|uniref:hypothetical protein n=1 Tax=Mycobacterium sp. Lab-001 TaxID=3410136 RepID=UPI003D178D97
MTDYFDLPDRARCVGLGDVGLPDYAAATVIGSDGATHFVLAQGRALGDPDVRYDAECCDVAHEQSGPLPLEYIRRLTISRRRQRTEGP